MSDLNHKYFATPVKAGPALKRIDKAAIVLAGLGILVGLFATAPSFTDAVALCLFYAALLGMPFWVFGKAILWVFSRP